MVVERLKVDKVAWPEIDQMRIPTRICPPSRDSHYVKYLRSRSLLSQWGRISATDEIPSQIRGNQTVEVKYFDDHKMAQSHHLQILDAVGAI